MERNRRIDKESDHPRPRSDGLTRPRTSRVNIDQPNKDENQDVSHRSEYYDSYNRGPGVPGPSGLNSERVPQNATMDESHADVNQAHSNEVIIKAPKIIS